MSRPIIKLSAFGADVAALHQLLAENGFPCATGVELSPPVFGSETLAAVRLFQACNVGPDGGHLAPDGVVGPATWWSLESRGIGEKTIFWVLPDMPLQDASNPVAAAALASAWGELRLGVGEVPAGSNRGPRVDLYTGFQGRPPEVQGPPWCAYFASWNFARAPGGSPFGRVGGALAIVEYCRVHVPDSIVDVRDEVPAYVGPGDLGIIETDPGHGHVFQVAAVQGGTAWTVEGNSGNAVRTRKRLVSSARWYVNFDRYARERGL